MLGLGVDGAVIDGLDPGGEQLVEPGHVVDVGVGDLDEELVAHGAEDPLDLARGPRAGPGREWISRMPEAGAGAQQLGGHERAAVVQIDGLGHTPDGQPGSQGGLGPHGVLGGHPPIAGEQPGVVVQEREQDGLVPADDRAVQGVADPQLVRP